jgi:glyceraldehyde 3-phosphate dehydrogenase
MKTVCIAINGFGRIGRAFLKVAKKYPELSVVAVNDLGDIENLAYLLKYDTAYGKAPFSIEVRTGENPAFIIDGAEVRFVSEKDPVKLPWKDLGIDIVIESTGFFETYEKANAHILAGARRVVVTAPVKGTPTEGISGATVLMGINEERLRDCQISSNASCTTNAASPLLAILHETIGIEKAILNTIHAYTATQRLVDSPDAKDWRRGRAGAANIIPSTTGAAIAVTEGVTDLKDRFDGIAVRVPVVTGSLVDVTFIAKRDTTVEEVNGLLEAAAKDARWEGLFTATYEQLVSSDIIGAEQASIADLSFTKVVAGNLVKVLAWYDNEMGYTHALVRHVRTAAKYL